jgi:hypothetical protein
VSLPPGTQSGFHSKYQRKIPSSFCQEKEKMNHFTKTTEQAALFK